MPGETTKLQQTELRLFLTSRCCTFPHFMAPFRCHQACPSTLGPVSSWERRGAVGQAAACGATCSSPLNFPSPTEPGEGCKPRRAQTCCTRSPIPGRVCVCAGTPCAGSLAGSQ